MPHRDWRERLSDIQEAIEKIQRYTEGLSFHQFTKDSMLVDAVIRNLTIIGEATSHIPDEIQSKADDLPWSEMRGMRNIVVHEYFGVSLRVLWDTIQHDLPPLVESLKSFREESE